MIGFFSALPLVAILFGSSSDEIDSLRRKAVTLLEAGDPAKALTLLKRARSTDSVQSDIDRQIQRCRIKLGKWVAPDVDPGWVESADSASPPVQAAPEAPLPRLGGSARADSLAGGPCGPETPKALASREIGSSCDSVVLAASERWKKSIDSLRLAFRRDTVPSGDKSGIRVIRYRLSFNMNLRRVANKFYGSPGLSAVLARWNGLEDSTAWRKMRVGQVVEVPFWRDLEYGSIPRAQAMSDIDWSTARLPKRGKP